MSNDKLIATWNSMNPDNNTKERILQQLQDTLKSKCVHHSKRVFRRFAIGFATLFIVILGSFGTAYAASDTFRNYIHSLFFPLYTSDEIISIESGHMTGSFDKTDVLLSFLDSLSQYEFGNSITPIKTNGYHYSLFAQDDDHLQAFVDSSVEGYCIAVFMERLEYQNTGGIWQVTGYQILKNTAAETMKTQLELYSDMSSEETISNSQIDTSIKGTEDSVILYNVNNKKNIVSIALNEDDSQIICDILEGCDQHEDIRGDLFQYVIKINNVSYMFDSRGDGMMDDSGYLSGITIENDDLKTLMELFESYHISLEET